MARIVHDSGPRASAPLIDVNCAAIPETLLEAELFGYAVGAFTDARQSKPGLFEAASGGTLFLDEIEALPLALQPKLLTAIEAKRARRLGAVTEQAVDVKPIAATQGELSDRVAVYAVVGLGPRQTSLEARIQRPLTGFVGRARELATLEALTGQVIAGRGQVVGVVGEPGVGKTRLLYEFTRAERPHHWSLLETRAASYSKGTPYRPLIELLKTYFRIEDCDDRPTVRERITGRLRALDAAFEPTLSALLALLDVPVEDPHWQALDPLQRRQRTLDACTHLLLRQSQLQLLLVVVEDLHWIDTETQAFLDSLVEHLPTARILLLLSYRPEYLHQWGSKSCYTQLRLHPLPPESAEALLEGLLGNDSSLALLKPRLIDRTRGTRSF